MADIFDQVAPDTATGVDIFDQIAPELTPSLQLRPLGGKDSAPSEILTPSPEQTVANHFAQFDPEEQHARELTNPLNRVASLVGPPLHGGIEVTKRLAEDISDDAAALFLGQKMPQQNTGAINVPGLRNVSAFANNPTAPSPSDIESQELLGPKMRAAEQFGKVGVTMPVFMGEVALTGGAGLPAILGTTPDGEVDPVGLVLGLTVGKVHQGTADWIKSKFFADTVKNLAPSQMRAMYQRFAAGQATAEDAALMTKINELKTKGQSLRDLQREGGTMTVPWAATPKQAAVAKIAAEAGGMAAANGYFLAVQMPSILSSENPKEALLEAVAQLAGASVPGMSGLAKGPGMSGRGRLDINGKPPPPSAVQPPPPSTTGFKSGEAFAPRALPDIRQPEVVTAPPGGSAGDIFDQVAANPPANRPSLVEQARQSAQQATAAAKPGEAPYTAEQALQDLPKVVQDLKDTLLARQISQQPKETGTPAGDNKPSMVEQTPAAPSPKTIFPATTPSPAIPVKKGGRKGFRIQPRSDGIADVLDAIQEEGGLRSPTAADVSDGDYDGFKEAMIGPAALLRRRTEGHHPTDIVKAIQAEFPRIKTSGDLYQAIRDAVAQRDNLRRNGGGAEAQQQRFWDAATAPKSTSGLVKINANQLAIGHTFRLRAPGVSHEELTVTHIDADTGEVQVKDGTSFGVQDLPDGAEIWVQKKGLASELNPAQVKPTDAPPVANPATGNQPAAQPGGKPKTGGAISPPVADPGILRARERLERQLRTIAGAEAGTIRLASGPVSNSDGHSRGRSLATDLQSVAHVFGKSVVWFTTHNVEPGRQVYGWGGDPSGKYIFVSAEHPLTALGTTFHELLHQFQKSNPDLYADFKKEMLAMARIPGSEYERLKRYAGYKGDLGDELLADFAGDAFNDPKFLRDFATRNPGLFRRVVNRLIRFLDKVLTQLTRASKASREVFDDLQAARDRLAKAMADWAADEASVRQVRADIDKANGENKQFSVDASSPFPERPALPRGLPAGEQVQAIKKHADNRKSWEQDVKSWVAAQPENKPLVFEDGPHRVALISKDTAEVGKWRTTRFVNREPSGHLIFSSRADAVLDALTMDGFKTYAPQTRFSTDFDNDLFSAPESVADQKARLDREKRATDERKAKEAMQARAAARLTGKDIDTTQDAFANAATTRLDKSGQGSFFSTDMEQSGPLWRSNMQDALATWQPKGTPQQLLAHLAKTKGAMDEAEWIGLDEFLKDKPSVTKAQVQEFVKANTVDIREAQKSARPLMTERERLAKRDEMARFLFNAPFDDLPMSQRITVENDLAQTPQDGTPKFDRYQLPGGENYRELLLTLPSRVNPGDMSNIRVESTMDGRVWNAYDGNGNYLTSARTREQAIDQAIAANKTGNWRNVSNFQSSHFDEPNIVAHVRFNERTDADGKRVLFLEEVQSDWHQNGRKHGYNTQPDTTGWKAIFRGRNEASDNDLMATYEVWRADGTRAGLYDGTSPEAAIAGAAANGYASVPNAPFKQTWPMLAMKRMIRYAAEHGFDRIGWTTGDQQAERYDLSKQVDSIRLTKKASGSYTIEVTRNGRSEAELIKDGVKPNDLGDYIGKELASKALAAPEQEEQVFAGDNLRVGGKGMRKFYDEMLPSEVNKFVKKWGGRVERGSLVTDRKPTKQYETEQWRVTEKDGEPTKTEQVHSLDITPAMRESAMQGMPMFSTDFDPPDVATLDKLKSDITAAEQALKTAVRAAVDPNRSIPRADADQAAALATANLRALQDEYDKHPDRLRAMPLPELEAHAQATAARLAQVREDIAALPIGLENSGADAGDARLSQWRSDEWRLLREARRIAAERWNRPEIVADVLRKAEKLTDALRVATKAQDATAMRHAIEELQALQDAEFTQIKPDLLAAVRADLEAKGEIKPLAVDKRGRTLADLTDWMKARKLDSPKLTLKERVNLAKRLADEFNAGKDKLTHALVRSRAMWQAFKAQWKAPLKDDSVRSIFKEWHYEKQFSGIETHQFASKLRADIPKKVRRMAISVWLDANGDRGLLTAQKMDVPARFLPVWTAALNLTADEKALAMRLKQDFAQKLADGQLLGLIEKGRDSYGVPQIWEVFPQHGEDYAGGDGKSKRPRNPGAKLDPRDPFFALKRTHDTYFDGIMAGGIPRSLDIADLVGVYNVEFHGALADRSVIKALKDAKMPDNTAAVKVSGGAKIEVLPTGARVQFVDSNWKPADAVAADGRPYRAVDHWALRGWKFAATDAAGNPIMVQGDFLVHPDLYAKIKTQLEGKSALRDPEGPLGAIAHVTGALLKTGAFLKASKFASATFHGATLAEHMMTHAFSGMPSRERLALLNPYVGGVEINPAKDREVANLIRHGMDMGFGGYRAMFEEGLTSHGGIWAHVPGLGDAMAWLSDGMFKEYLPRLKVKLGKAVLHANRARYSSKLTEQQIYELTASQVNAAFGGQNWALLGRSKTFLDVNRLFLTAPDFLLSRAKVVGQALKPYNREQMLFILAQAALVYGAARIFNLLLDDDPHWEPENALQVIHGGKSWSARFIVNDMLHAVTDPAGFASGRLGPWPRTGFEMITGRDMRTGARKDVPIDTENPAFRAAQIAAVDLAQWLIPVGADGLLPGATGREQTGPGQFALGLVGVGSRRYTAETEMFQLAAKFNRGSEDPRANRQQKMRDDAPKQQSAYRKLDVLLEADDLAGARKEYAALQKDGHTKDAIAARMKAITDGHLAHPFTGSQEREKQFKASLTPEQRMEYERAVALRKERAAKFSRMLQTTQ